MPLPLLQTKLYVPPPRLHLVSRPAITAKLCAGVWQPLTLIAAPAGFGKTTLVSEWISANAESSHMPHSAFAAPHAIAWVSLDEEDNDPTRFLAYVIAALQTQQPEIGATALALLSAPQAPPPKAILTLLINELGALTTPLALILDDYHLITTTPIHEAIAFFIDHLPPKLHLIITSRVDPPLPLARWRVRNQLTELRADDLRFRPAEVATFLNEVMGLTLTAEQIATLETRTEGWIAGLQLAALSLQGVADRERFIAAFGGTNRYIVDYLMAEVLNQQTQEVYAFLLQTSLLERLCGPLCDAVIRNERSETGDSVAEQASTSNLQSQAILEHLEHANLFLIPLDAERKWYRHHQLFAEVLSHRLRQTQGEEVPALHQRASAWYEQQELWSETIHHALAAEDFGRAGRLIEQVGIALFAQTNIQHSLRRWLSMLPTALIRERPQLCLIYAWILFVRSDIAAGLSWVAEAEAAIQHNPASTAATPIRGEIAAMRAILVAYNPTQASTTAIMETITWGQQALASLSDEQATFRSVAAEAIGSAYMKQGDVVRAEQALAEANRMGRAAGNAHVFAAAALNQVAMQRALGALGLALATCREALAWITQHNALAYPIVGGLYLNLADLLREQNDLDAAQHTAQEAIAQSDQGLNPTLIILSRLVLIRIKHAQGDWAQARTLLREVAALVEQHPTVIHSMLLPAITAQIQVAEGISSPTPGTALEVALKWAQSTIWEEIAAVSAYRFLDLVYLYEHSRIARAQVFIAWARRTGDHRFLPETLAYLKRQQQIAEAGSLGWFQIKLHILQALAHQVLGDTGEAQTALTHALRLAQPEGFVRVFVDEGEPIRLLILDYAEASVRRFTISEQPMRAYVNQLLAAFENRDAVAQRQADDLPKKSLDEQIQNPKSSDANVRIIQNLVEPLSERELEILRLVNRGLSNREIADRLIISIGTVKKHLNNIFGKLGASHRAQALAHARDFNLL